jgi:hypothetical protein
MRPISKVQQLAAMTTTIIFLPPDGLRKHGPRRAECRNVSPFSQR